VVRGNEGFMRLNMRLDFVNRSSAGKHCAVAAKGFGAVGVARISGSQSSFIRARTHLADGRDLISIVISGGGRFQVEGVRGLDRYGYGAAVLESRCESTLHCLDDTSGWTICMERAPIEPLLAGIRGPLQRCLSGDTPGLRLLAGYLEALFGLDQCDLSLACLHIHDLTLNALGITGDVQALVRERGVSVARQRMLLEHIAQHAGEPDLDPVRVAERLGMSPRYLHRLLEPTGHTFSEHLLAARLEHAAAMLRDPRFARVKIAVVAQRSGFADISHFNRTFRHAFGDTPLGVRVRAARRKRD
jgi:AraC-like DNA-binding protein